MVWDWMYLFIGIFVWNECSVVKRFPSWTHVKAQLFGKVDTAGFFADTTSVGQLIVAMSIFLAGPQAIKVIPYKDVRDFPVQYNVRTF